MGDVVLCKASEEVEEADSIVQQELPGDLVDLVVVVLQ